MHERGEDDCTDIRRRDLYPALNDEELKYARGRLARYLDIVLEIQRDQVDVMEKMRYIGNTPKLPKNGEIRKIMETLGAVGAQQTLSHRIA